MKKSDYKIDRGIILQDNLDTINLQEIMHLLLYVCLIMHFKLD